MNNKNTYREEPLLICRKCLADKMSVPWGFATYRGFYNMYKTPEDMKCRECGSQLETTLLNCGEYDDLNKVSHDQNFILSMIQLKETDIIEYNIKMSQFKANISTQKAVEEESKPHCPHCKSTNIKSISGLNRGTSIAMWGIFSKKINKSFECKDCGYTW